MLTRLRNRLLLLNMAIITIVMVTAFAAIYTITYTDIRKENARKLASVPLALPNVGVSAPDPAEPQFKARVFIGRIPVDYSLSFEVLLDSGGRVTNVLSYVDMPGEFYVKISETAWGTGKRSGTVTLENRRWQYLVSPLEDKVLVGHDGVRVPIYGDGSLHIVFLDITDSSNTLNRLLVSFVVMGFAVSFCLFGVSLHFANSSIRPIEHTWEKQKQFVADASHELKTPLAIIGANIDALLANGDETVNSQRKWVDYIRSETGRMAKLGNDMLYLAMVEAAPEDHRPFDISSAVLDVIASMEAMVFERGIVLKHAVEPGIVVRGDVEQVKQAVVILLDNAAKYVDQGGRIDMTLRKSRSTVVFSIRNSGKGIPADKLPRVFDRFYRGDPSRSQDTGGYGLGLAIAKAIVERGGGSIHAESTESSTTFTFTLRAS